MKRLNRICLPLLLMVGACTTPSPDGVVSGSRRPSWMDNPQHKYPFRYFIAAVGEGDTLSDSQSAAVGNLAKIFKSEIDVEENLQERYFELMGDKNSYQEQTRFDRDVRINSAMSLINVRYAESYKDETGRIYSLAFINRAKTAEIYTTRLKENDVRTVDFVERSKGAVPSVTYAALSAAVAISTDSRLLLEQLDIISPTAKKSIRMTYGHDLLAGQLAEAAGMVHFSVQVSNDCDDKIRGALESLVTGMGFVIDEKSELKIRSRVAFEDTDLKRGNLSFVRYEAKLDLVDIGGQTVVSVSKRGREGHVSKAEAQSRCVRTIVSLIDRDFRIRIQAYFDGLVNR